MGGGASNARPGDNRSATGSSSASADVAQAQEALLEDAGTNGNGGKKQKPKKVPKFERLRVTGGDSEAVADWLHETGVEKRNPLNAWGAGSSSSAARTPAAPKPKAAAVWGSAGVAQRDRAASGAWSKR